VSVLLKAFFKKNLIVQMQQWYRGRVAGYKLRGSRSKAACGHGNFLILCTIPSHNSLNKPLIMNIVKGIYFIHTKQERHF
jgi:hypothetical protein